MTIEKERSSIDTTPSDGKDRQNGGIDKLITAESTRVEKGKKLHEMLLHELASTTGINQDAIDSFYYYNPTVSSESEKRNALIGRGFYANNLDEALEINESRDGHIIPGVAVAFEDGQFLILVMNLFPNDCPIHHPVEYMGLISDEKRAAKIRHRYKHIEQTQNIMADRFKMVKGVKESRPVWRPGAVPTDGP